jgi:hypothetical protein
MDIFTFLYQICVNIVESEEDYGSIVSAYTSYNETLLQFCI